MPILDIDAELRDFVEAERERLHVPGAAVGIIHGDDEWYAGFGVTNVAAPAAVDEATLFQIGSNTKTFVATAIMCEVESGRVDLDAPVQRYLPEFQLGPGGDAAAVTIRHLLTHTGGWDGDWTLTHPVGGRDDDALVRELASHLTSARLEPTTSERALRAWLARRADAESGVFADALVAWDALALPTDRIVPSDERAQSRSERRALVEALLSTSAKSASIEALSVTSQGIRKSQPMEAASGSTRFFRASP